MSKLRRHWTTWTALLVGIGSVVASLTVTSTTPGRGLTLAFGAFIVFFAALALLARVRTPGCWGLVAIGLGMTMLPFLGGAFAPDPGAGWTGVVAGPLAMTLGAIGWVTGRPPTVTGISHWGRRDAKRNAMATLISGTSLMIGLATVLLGATVVRSSTAAVAITVGLGVFMTVAALWSWLAADPTRDYFMLATVGFALFLAPTAAGFSGDAAAWAAWIPGAVTTVLGVTGYLRGDAIDLRSNLRKSASARYEREFRSHGSPA
ncbi:hypothetical protein [Mycobacterium sp. IS-1590]|uniref:hypothetical protein n=1 Tax=Mycobacterium sp. IS-1590 TaxID=1772286 RepID=UPI000B2161C0|nr:hypothetical protein [Mycobacterium sp. IS-1590]